MTKKWGRGSKGNNISWSTADFDNNDDGYNDNSRITTELQCPGQSKVSTTCMVHPVKH